MLIVDVSGLAHPWGVLKSPAPLGQVDNCPAGESRGTHAGFGARQIWVQIPLLTHSPGSCWASDQHLCTLWFFESINKHCGRHLTGLL